MNKDLILTTETQRHGEKQKGEIGKEREREKNKILFSSFPHFFPFFLIFLFLYFSVSQCLCGL
ncbi:MAG TPA: hypothetical protein DCQ99_07985 [Nitrospinae bacterium]|nr:hypothetical protein [Nitrospinota bacterium]HBA27526.1 hypothetical protein [Nitrospinota bacterium]